MERHKESSKSFSAELPCSGLEKAKDEAKHNGHLTKREQRKLNKRENKISRHIYKDKHNAKTTTPVTQ